MTDDNGRVDILIEWLTRVEKKLDLFIRETAEARATIRNHGFALRFLFGILGAVIVAVVVGFVGGR